MIWEIRIESPFLPMRATGTEDHLLRLQVDPVFREEKGLVLPALAKEVRSQLNAYFKGDLKSFDLPYHFESGTPFQRSCWEILAKIPYGETLTYGEQAKLLGDINKSRAVGGANSRNPIAIVIPCHRVIGANGKMTGYTTPFGQDLNLKQNLLNLESRR